MKYSDHPPALKEKRAEYIDDRWRELSEMQREAGRSAITYLMVCNSGGAVAVLSFMGAMKTTTPFQTAPAMLLFFVLGIIIVGFGRALAFYRVTARYKRWREAVHHFYRDEWTFEKAVEHDVAMGTGYPLGDAMGWAAFACFLIGVVLGISSLP